ncbi:MAG: RNA 2',3'-cyclic phosphodiesterase [Deltaproteobacteria bacterium]|nr:RNA 2',3'-cyclic phosphodiesterase [Deltaproteobacteria bacterium]
MSTIRSFVAIPIPDNIKKSVQDWVEPFRRHDSSIRWVRPEGIHLTLKFLGEVEEKRFENFFSEFTQLLTPFRPIRLSVKEVGQFPPSGTPRILWMGLSGEIDPLKLLVRSVDDFFERFGFPKEKRAFAPHVTIARIKEKPSSTLRAKSPTEGAQEPVTLSAFGGTAPLAPQVPQGGTASPPRALRVARSLTGSSGFLRKWHEAGPVSFGEFVADRVVFYKSELTKGGAVYSVIGEFELGKK